METTPQKTQTSYNLDPNIAAALAYLVFPFTGVLFLVIEKENKFVRFHAMQSVLFGIAVFAAASISAALVGVLLVPLVSIASFCLWLFLMWKAFNNIEYELPFLGQIAKKQVYK